MTNTSEDKAMLLQDGTRELTSEEVNLISGGVLLMDAGGAGDWRSSVTKLYAQQNGPISTCLLCRIFDKIFN